METFVGDSVRIILKTGIDISGYPTLEMHFRRPNGTTGSWTASLYGTNNTWMEYVTDEPDLDLAGMWSVQAYVEAGTGAFLHGKWVDFEVFNPIESLMPS